MTAREHRRKSKRYAVRWKAAVVFDKMYGKPILHTQTQDLSVDGTAMVTDYEDLTGNMVTLLLAQPGPQEGNAPKMLKIRARVVSTSQSQAHKGYRHGLSFVRAPGDGLDILGDLLAAAEAARAEAAQSAAAPAVQSAPAAAPTPAEPATSATPAAPAAGLSRLAQLKQMALAKQTEEKKPDPQEEINTRVSKAIEKAYWFLKEFNEQLNVVEPPYPKEYALVGAPGFSGLVWKCGHADMRTRELNPTTKAWEMASLYFKLDAGKELRVVRETPLHEKFNQTLVEYKIEFTTKEERNDRGALARTTFIIPCKIEARLQLLGNFETGKLLLKTQNIERFGTMTYELSTEAITDEALDELTGFILGETSRLGPLLLKGV